MEFGIMFFSSAQANFANKYGLLIDASKYADRNGFCCIWTPERHFHEFGGLFPNPSLTSAALAVITERIQLRAGSLIAPLHDTIRIAEEWSVVDNLSAGRVAISFGSGWNADDFIFFPERYADRQKVMFEQIDSVRALWSGASLVRENSFGRPVRVSIFPAPIQKELPIWITSSGNLDTFIAAGSVGANLLTHLIGQDIAALENKICAYREALASNGYDPQLKRVSLMLHTFLGDDVESVRAKVRNPFREYLRTAVSLEQKAARSGGVVSGGHKIESHDIPDQVIEDLLDVTFERYFSEAALMGTPSSCRDLVLRLKSIGVDEIACLIDFLDDREGILKSLGYVNELRALFAPDAMRAIEGQSLDAFLDRID